MTSLLPQKKYRFGNLISNLTQMDVDLQGMFEKLLPKHEKLLAALSEELKKEIPEAGLPTCFPPLMTVLILR